MLEIQRNDGSWIKFSCPEWNTFTAEKQAEIIKRLKEKPFNIIPFKNPTGLNDKKLYHDRLFDHTAN